MTTDAIPDLVRRQRLGLIDTLTTLTHDEWLTPSLCDQWRVVDVAAHLAWAPVLGMGAGAFAMARHGFSMNRMIARSAIAWSARGREAILDQLRHNAHSGARPFAMPPVAALADAVVHGIDVRLPLGLPGQVPPTSLAPLADFTLSTPWPLNTVVGGSSRRRVAGVRLVATDVAWSHGEGPAVRGSAEALLMLLFGRRLGSVELSGPGAEVVLRRCDR